ncbi:DUF349 domain-containing protein [Thalassolituus sp. LLYu03]|uniref:DUF349 domain-containing protein n=1 Tax=Thalassolituus sp. LLYu03 TaxID=3421656 RepID=UPI003D26AB68
MAFFKKLFKAGKRNSDWKTEDADGRRQALQAFRSDNERLEFIRHESSKELRQLALSLIEGDAALDALLSFSDDAIRKEARARLLSNLMPGNDLNRISDTATLLRIAALTDDNDLRLSAVGKINDEQERLTIATTHAVAKVRAAAAEGIQQPALLQALAEHAQSKDKTLYRMAKEKLAALKAVQEEQADRIKAAQHLLSQLHYLNKVGYHPEFNGKLQIIRQQWPQVQAAASAQDHADFSAALVQAEAVLNSHQEEEARQQQAQAAASKAQDEQKALSESLTALQQDALTLTPDALQQQLKDLESRWHHTFAHHKPAEAVARAFENGLQQLFGLQSALQQSNASETSARALLTETLPETADALRKQQAAVRQILNAIRWPEAVSRPDWLSALDERAHALQERLAAFGSQAESRLKDIATDLKAFEQSLTEGHLKEAGRLSQRIQNALRQVEQKQSAALQREYRALTARLQDMRDWAGFATQPKKAALAEAMEALVGSALSPDVLADKIHAMQDEWKTLNTGHGDAELWERFKAAADKAYEPCRAYFAELGELRERNLALRNALISELDQYEAFMDWTQADWKVVQRTLDTARDTFRAYSPVDRHSHKETHTRFSDVCDRIYAHIRAEQDNNLNLKQSIVNQAAELAQAGDLSNAADRVKTLQANWKAVGITQRGPDQKLWQQFREHCDAVFARLNESRNARKAEIDELVTQAEGIVAQATALLNADAGDAGHQLSELNQAFAALTLPKGAHQRLSQQLKAVAGELRNRREAEQKVARQQSWQGLIARLDALAAGDDAWQSANALPLPEGYQQSLFDAARADFASRTDNSTANDLCILMEIVADAATADSDRARRMELQVQRLADGLGKGLTTEQERIALTERWLSEGTPALQARFISAVKASF